MEYAGLLGAGNIPLDDEEVDERNMPVTTATAPRTPPAASEYGRSAPMAADARQFTVPLSRDREVRLEVPKELDEAGWTLMMAILNAMKPGIVTTPSPAKEDAATEPGSID